MTPIFVRPVREQLEHDRLIRFLLARFKAKRKFEVLANAGDERQAPIKVGNNIYFPDLILLEGKKVAALIEIETGESTNNLEAMAQWTHFSHARVPFHLYVPVLAVDAARRLCEANNVMATEIWSYRPVNDQFDLVRVHLNPDAVKASSKGSKAASVPVVLPPPKPAPPPPPPVATATAAPPASPKPSAKAGEPKSKAGAPAMKPQAKSGSQTPVKAAPAKPAAKPAARAAAPKAKPQPKSKPKPKASPKPKAKAGKPKLGSKKK